MNTALKPQATAEFVSRLLAEKPQLVVHSGNLPATAHAAASLIADAGLVYYRGGRLVKVVIGMDDTARIVSLSHHSITEMVHQVCQPVTLDKDGVAKAMTFPERAARMLIDSGDVPAPELDGITASVLLADDGTIRAAEGYDQGNRLYCHRVPAVNVKARPSRADAGDALVMIRDTFATFPWIDGPRLDVDGISVADTTMPAGEAESAFLCSLMTAICRASLRTAPGFICTAPEMSGAGSGKGLLVSAMSLIAFGTRPTAFTTGNEKGELEKRIASELMDANPVLFLDNANGIALKSDTLASVITESPARVRVYGETRMVALNSTAWIAVTGNGLSMSEDLVRRFLCSELDPKCEDPEAREFADGREVFLRNIMARRAELLAAGLTIWRWGRQNADTLDKGKPFGNFETWAKWIRDPLITLGCADPVERIARAKANDPRRMRITELFNAWWEHHHNYSIKVAGLHEAVAAIIDPQARGRQYLATKLGTMHGTRAAGYVLTRQEAAGKFAGATYQLSKERT